MEKIVFRNFPFIKLITLVVILDGTFFVFGVIVCFSIRNYVGLSFFSIFPIC